ncbi:MAG: phage minor capsid protein, partial [Stackebrandtia sp.]
MAVDPEHFDALTGTVVELYREAETALVRLIANHVGDFPDAPPLHWAEQKLAAVRTLRRSAQAIADRLNRDSGTAIRDAVAAAYRAGTSSAMTILRKWLPGHLADALHDASAELPGFASVEALASAVHHDVGAKSSNILRDTVDAYRGVIAAASVRTLTGSNTRRQAGQAAWRRFMDEGITGFTDRSGRKWALSSYVEMVTRTVTQRAAVTGETDRLESLGVGLVYVSNAAQECALCRPFEGRVLSLTGRAGAVTVEHQLTGAPVTVDVVASLVEARVRGLFHPNCRHSVSAYLPGVTTLPAQPTADPKGDAARQRQRAIERAIRKHKIRQAGAIDPKAKKAAAKKVRQWQAEMRDHLDDHPDLRRLPYREQVGAGNIPKAGHHDPAGHITKPPPPEPPTPPPLPKPGDSVLAMLLDVDDTSTTLDAVETALADGDGLSDERTEWAAAVHRFHALADKGAADTGYATFLPKLGKSKDPVKYVRRRLGQLKT